MIWAKIRKTDYRVIELNSENQGFDTNLFLEVNTDQVFNSTDDYVFNHNSNSFYNIGIKEEIAAPPVTSVQPSPFSSADGFRFRGKGYSGIANKSPDGNPNVTIIDWQLTEERFINGTHTMLKGHVFNDSYDIEIVDKDYLFAGALYPEQYDVNGDGSLMIDWSVAVPSGVILDSFIKGWFVVADMQGQKPIKLSYPARLLAGMYIRLTYRAHGQVDDVELKLNGFMHLKVEA